jgi:hypothetical protein
MRATWTVAAAVLVGGLAACGFYDAVPRSSDPFGPDIGLPNLPDASVPIPDGGEVIMGDGGYRDRDGGIHIPGGDGGFPLPDAGTLPDAGMDGGSDAGISCGELMEGAEVLARGEYFPSTLAVSPTEVLWVDGRLALRRMPKAGTNQSPSGTVQLASPVLQVDAEAVYVVTQINLLELLKLPHGSQSSISLTQWIGSPLPSGGLAQNATTLFAGIDASIWRVDKAGERQAQPLNNSGRPREALTADDAGVYYSELGSPDLHFIGVESSAPTTIATLAADFHAPAMHAGPAGLTVMAEPVTSSRWDCPGGRLMRRAVGGTGLGTLTYNAPGCVLQLTADATHAYWTAFVPGSGYFLLRLHFITGGVYPLTQIPEQPQALAVDDSHVYWSQSQTGCIVRVPKPQ